ncbi:hypothetical protein Vafri_21847 [Volvox africanus]|uniref:Uncharacterized protein n=1 Tax=Volvox africanus TaxID=51714 RepID=A0A8J4FEC7_9CHLO|nr:hypothetical protein Vafri_21847 [Volvox africanus]
MLSLELPVLIAARSYGPGRESCSNSFQVLRHCSDASGRSTLPFPLPTFTLPTSIHPSPVHFNKYLLGAALMTNVHLANPLMVQSTLLPANSQATVITCYAIH